MRQHPRAQVVDRARREIDRAIGEAEQRYDLTFAEIFGILGGQIQSFARSAIRAERHPDDPDAPGGLE